MNKRALILSAALLPTLALVSSARAGDWLQWRGPEHDGVTAESGGSHDWPADGPKVAWKAKVGFGFSSFVVGDGRVFTMGNADDKDTVFCFDAATGKELWKHSYRAELGDKYFEGGTTGTPTINGDRVYTLSRWGDAFCFNAKDGAVVWSKNVEKETGARQPDWGFGGAPLVQGANVYLNVGEAGLALDKMTGAIVWKSESKAAGYSTPLPIKEGGQDLAVFSSGQSYTAVDLSDGKPVWSTRWLTQYGVNASDPIIDDGRLFLSTGYGKGASLFKLGGKVPELLWKSKALHTQLNAAVLYKGHLYGPDGDTSGKAALKCLEFATGKELWSQANFGTGGLIVADGWLIALSGNGELMTAPASPEGFKPTSRAQVLGGKTWTAPVLANGFVYCRNSRGDVVCLNLRK
jgi:outer membrane protein assembly factor BamB